MRRCRATQIVVPVWVGRGRGRDGEGGRRFGLAQWKRAGGEEGADQRKLRAGMAEQWTSGTVRQPLGRCRQSRGASEAGVVRRDGGCRGMRDQGST